jgi:phosphoglycolate phosphatase-like HAD superfamily hydrolase
MIALPSWNEGSAKQQIIDFVERAELMPKDRRIAVFDNDGTLCPQNPLMQVAFIQTLAAKKVQEDPELLNTLAYKLFAEKNHGYRKLLTSAELDDFYSSIQSGMTQQEYKDSVTKFFEEERHPDFNKLYTEVAYQPMKELIGYLKEKKFRVYINTAGDTDFVRIFAFKAFNIKPNKVIGLSRELQKEGDDGFRRLKAHTASSNNRENKMLSIERIIGRPPIFAMGDADGDIEMLSYAKAQKLGLAVLLKHDDHEREYDDTHHAKIALKTAEEKGWTVVSMKDDFKRLF